MENWLTYSPIPGMVIWVILYISDYYLTLSSAKGYQEIGHFKFETSFELTPQYQKDIDGRVKISRLHLTLLTVYTLFILLLWYIFADLLQAPQLYSIYLGMFLLLETAIHFRHFRNLFMIRTIKKEGGVDGLIEYSRRFSYRLSAFDLYMFSLLFIITAAVTFSPFFLGGALMCFGTGLKHSRQAAKLSKVSSTVDINANPSS